MDFTLVLPYLLQTGRTLEWKGVNGRLYCISGKKTGRGFWHARSLQHAAWERAEVEELKKAFFDSLEFTLYTETGSDGMKLTRRNLFALIEQAFPAAHRV